MGLCDHLVYSSPSDDHRILEQPLMENFWIMMKREVYQTYRVRHKNDVLTMMEKASEKKREYLLNVVEEQSFVKAAKPQNNFLILSNKNDLIMKTFLVIFFNKVAAKTCLRVLE